MRYRLNCQQAANLRHANGVFQLHPTKSSWFPLTIRSQFPLCEAADALSRVQIQTIHLTEFIEYAATPKAQHDLGLYKTLQRWSYCYSTNFEQHFPLFCYGVLPTTILSPFRRHVVLNLSYTWIKASAILVGDRSYWKGLRKDREWTVSACTANDRT